MKRLPTYAALLLLLLLPPLLGSGGAILVLLVLNTVLKCSEALVMPVVVATRPGATGPMVGQERQATEAAASEIVVEQRMPAIQKYSTAAIHKRAEQSTGLGLRGFG
jgi:hypothetical protein